TRDVFDHTSQVLEISDATSGAGVIMVNTRIQGVLHGNSWGQPQIVNLSPDDRIKPGEPVVTSGGDSIFPRGLPVGAVEKITPDPEGTLVNVLLKPAANLQRLEEVLVITNAGDQMPGGMQQDLNDAQEKASEILAERLPSRADPNAPGQPSPTGTNPTGTQQASGTAQSPPKLDNGLPTPPPKPPLPVHADRYSSDSILPAEDMVPGKPAGTAASAPGADATPPAEPETERKKPAPKKPVVPATEPSTTKPQQSPPTTNPATPPTTSTPQGRI
ncbi:MAG: rod shape-determining protein MreC, partial [Acidobacteriaceae bacterium]